MTDDIVKRCLHSELREAQQAVLSTLDGLSEYDGRRPLTPTGTNLLGLVKHLATWEARYLGEVFGRPCPEPLPRWDDASAPGSDLWARADESRADVVAMFERVTTHSDVTIEALDLVAGGHVPWWPRPDVALVDVLVHLIAETNRHAGHADILREQLDADEAVALTGRDDAFWQERWARIEQAALDAAAPDD